MPIRHLAVPYASLSSLPEAPRELLAQLARTPVDRAPEWHAGHAFELIADLFQNYARQTTSQVLPCITIYSISDSRIKGHLKMI